MLVFDHQRQTNVKGYWLGALARFPTDRFGQCPASVMGYFGEHNKKV